MESMQKCHNCGTTENLTDCLYFGMFIYHYYCDNCFSEVFAPVSKEEEKELTDELTRLLDKTDLCDASKVLPKNHPIRPALKRAINGR